MASEIKIEDIVSAYGDHYIDNGQNLTNLRSQFYTPAETAATLQRIPTVNTEEQGALITQGSVLQGYQPVWTPYGTTTLKPHKIQLYEQKIDLSYTADELGAIAKSWVGFLAALDTADRSQWPFIRYMIEVHILKKRDEDYELQAIYKGEYDDAVSGTPTPANKSMMGLKYIVNKAIADGYAMSIALGVPPTDPVAFVDYFEAFVKGIPEIVRSQVDMVRMSPNLRQRYKEGMRKKYNASWEQTKSLLTHIDYDDMAVRGFHSMAGSNKIFASIKNNLVEYTKRPQAANVFKVETSKRTVDLFTDWHKGVGANDPRYLFSNDQELTLPTP